MVGVIAAALAVLVAWPASTPPVMGPDGRPAPRGIAEMANVRLGGADQTIMIRAADPDKPVVLVADHLPRADVGVKEVRAIQHSEAGRRDLAHEWFDGLTAPHKELITYDDAGHSVVFEEADAFHRLMTEWIVPATYRK
jgi:pimeloyl-ACP methyl ester carboxylesterase